MLVVGATRVLRPAVLECIGRGWTVVAVARSRPDLAALASAAGPLLLPVPLDLADPGAVRPALTGTVLRDRVHDALVYYATDEDASENSAIDMLAPVVSGTTVRLLTSRWFPTSAPGGTAVRGGGRWPRRDGRLHLLLGVRPDGTWHDPQQISTAALAALHDGHDAVLGGPPHAGARWLTTSALPLSSDRAGPTVPPANS